MLDVVPGAMGDVPSMYPHTPSTMHTPYLTIIFDTYLRHFHYNPIEQLLAISKKTPLLLATRHFTVKSHKKSSAPPN